PVVPGSKQRHFGPGEPWRGVKRLPGAARVRMPMGWPSACLGGIVVGGIGRVSHDGCVAGECLVDILAGAAAHDDRATLPPLSSSSLPCSLEVPAPPVPRLFVCQVAIHTGTAHHLCLLHGGSFVTLTAC